VTPINHTSWMSASVKIMEKGDPKGWLQ
jgi:hypothetical protein